MAKASAPQNGLGVMLTGEYFNQPYRGARHGFLVYNGVCIVCFDFFRSTAMIAPMLMIRLQRVARKHIPIFRVVLTDSRNSTKSGRFHEVLGSFNLKTDEKTINAERVKYWISKGAQPSGTLHNYLVHEKIIAGKKINVLPRRTPIKPEVKAEEKKEAVKAAPASPEAAQGEAKPAEVPASASAMVGKPVVHVA